MRATVRLWSGLRTEDEGLEAFLSKIIYHKPEANEIVVSLRNFSPSSSGASLLQEILNRYPSVFDFLRFEWEGEVRPQQVHHLFAKQEGAEWIAAPDGDQGVRWSNKVGEMTSRGQAWWLELSSHKTVVHIECINRDGDNLSLSFLRPSVLELVHQLNTVRIPPNQVP